MKRNAVALNFELNIPILEAGQVTLIQALVDGYRKRRVGARGHTVGSVEQALKAVQDFMMFTQSAPWAWTDAQWDDWTFSLATERKLATTTIRSYQVSVHGFINFAAASSLNERVFALTKRRVTQFITRDMMVRHADDRNEGKRRPAVARDHIQLLVDYLYDRAHQEDAKGSHQHAAFIVRDLTIVFTLYRYGLRISEDLGLNLDSFRLNKDCPQFGRFGICHAIGKGHHGSGPIPRDVPTMTNDVLPMLTWYLQAVRPALVGDTAETAFFLSSRGTRLTASDFRTRLKGYWKALDLGHKGYTPHCFRHSSVTHQLEDRNPLMFVRDFHGHLHASTTDAYAHFGSEYMRDEVKRLVSDELEAILGKTPEVSCP